MVLMFKEEKNIYNLVELTHESSIVQIKKSMRKVKCIKEKMNYTLKDMLKENLSIIPAYAKNTGLHVFLTLPTAKAGGFLLQPLLHWLIPFGISMSYTVSTS